MKLCRIATFWLIASCCLFEFVHAQNYQEVYRTEIKPLLRAKCFGCHGPLNQEAELRLDSVQLIRQGGDGGHAIDMNEVDTSLILQRVSTEDEFDRMPPEGDPLTRQQVSRLREWIAAGAPHPEDERAQPVPNEHWAFQPIADVSPPASDDPNPIDAFIRQRLAEASLEPAPPANPNVVVRRMYLDLHGLPPTLEELKTWTERISKSPLAVDKLIDHLLASPRYGERWAQHWLDVIRYADTHGFEVNTPRPHAWRYRDYVIRALNDDKPYDQFVFEQLAGDSVGEDAATGFLVAAPALLPGQIGQDDASKRLARQDSLDEMIVGTGASFLGLTIGCARCHDHKFDPITQKEYYEFQAFFAGVEYGDRQIQDETFEDRIAKAKELEPKIEELSAKLRAFEPHALSGQTRLPVDPKQNLDRFSAVSARFVRFTVLETIDNNLHEPCIDELEIYQAGDEPKNVARPSDKIKLTSSGNYSETGIHQIKHINDGKYGNSHSWISNEKGRGWIQLELPEAKTIDAVAWGRDREGKFRDRLATKYRIDVSLDGKRWTTVASSFDRAPMGLAFDRTNSLVEGAGVEKEYVSALIKDLDRLQKHKAELETPELAYAGVFGEPGKTFLLNRGDPEQQIVEVNAQVPGILGSLVLDGQVDEQQRRVQLARWMTSPSNPLTARIMVNRIWQNHFGHGLVSTPSDFGLNSLPPSHPELLDWLANQFIQSGWSIKTMHRLILSSETYRQSGQGNPSAHSIDSDCRLLWRFPTRRLEAESIRDSMLHVSGQLNLRMYGPGFDFFKTRGGLSGFPPVESFGESELRRMIYAHKIRMEPVPVFGAFDCPDAGQPTPVRSRSTTAVQALNLFNSEFVIEQSEKFAERLSSMEPDSIDRQVQTAFQIVYGRLPSESEQRASVQLVSMHELTALCRVLFNSNEFLFIP